ncbi:MAG TPA: integration host factor subunit beta [Desulfobacterales bacterium]|nr:integration host factor subunit beta [Desulfobacterales bacterium]
MTKSDLIEELSKQVDISQQEATSIVSTILQTMTQALVDGQNVEIRGFGSFTVRHYDSYTGRNPKTQVETVVKAKKLPFFKVGKELKEAVDTSFTN